MNALTMFVQLLPLALGAAVSPALLVVQLAILTGDARALKRSWSLAAGRMVSLAVITVGGTSLLALLPDFGKGLRASTGAAVIMGIAGVVLILLAVREAQRGPRAPRTQGQRRVDRLIDAPPLSLFAFGAAWMLVNASTLALYIPGLHVVSRAQVSWAARSVALLFLFLFASAAALAPPLAVSLFGDSVRPRLSRLQTWFERNGHLVSIAITGVFGLALLGFGLWNGAIVSS